VHDGDPAVPPWYRRHHQEKHEAVYTKTSRPDVRAPVPAFMFFAFFVGRKLDLTTFLPAFLAMMLFFTASSVGPLITPWENGKDLRTASLNPVTKTVLSSETLRQVQSSGSEFPCWYG